MCQVSRQALTHDSTVHQVTVSATQSTNPRSKGNLTHSVSMLIQGKQTSTDKTDIHLRKKCAV